MRVGVVKYIFHRHTFIASCILPLFAAISAILWYETPEYLPSFSAIIIANCSLSTCVCFT